MKNKKRNIIVIICVLFVGYIIYNYNNDSKYIKLEKSKLEDYLNCSDYLELTGDTCERLKHDFEGEPKVTFEPVIFEPLNHEPQLSEPIEFIDPMEPMEPMEPITYTIEPIKLEPQLSEPIEFIDPMEPMEPMEPMIYTPNRNYDYSPQTQEVQ